MLDRCYAVTLNTPDLAAVRAYYEHALQLAVLNETPGSTVTFDGGAVQITFEAFFRKPDSFAVLYFETEDVPHLCARLRSHGHNVPNEFRDRAELIDPDGRKIVVTERL